jgi:hypothetical protein
MSFELIIGENAGLFEAVHAFADFKIDISLGIEEVRGESIFFKDFVGNIPAMDSHVLKKFHVRAEEEIFEVAGTEAGTAFCI